MTDQSKLSPRHLNRLAYVYVRQSSPAKVQNHRESTERQYGLAERVIALGWRPDAIVTIDDDLGHSASGLEAREGFARMAAAVALGQVGIVVGLEVSRLARNNAAWYRLLDLCRYTDTLIADADGLYDPGDFNDRLVLGLKGTMSEAELRLLRARLIGGIRHKVAKGELRRQPATGYEYSPDGKLQFTPDEAVRTAIKTVFDRFGELGSARGVWTWFLDQGLLLPRRLTSGAGVRWERPSYHAIHGILTNPVYAGAYVWGRHQVAQRVLPDGTIQSRTVKRPQEDWHVDLQDHHPAYVDAQTFQAIQVRLRANSPAEHARTGGAPREGSALLQGLATCGHCGRRLRVRYNGANSTPGYTCHRGQPLQGRREQCLDIGGRQLERPVVDAFLAALSPARLEATLLALQSLASDFEQWLHPWRLAVERARYEAERSQRQYQQVEPENRLVARSLEAAWETALQELATAEAELARREQQRPRPPTAAELASLRTLGVDLVRVWSAPTTTDRDRKELLRTLLDRVVVRLDRGTAPGDSPEQQRPAVYGHAHLTLVWRGGEATELEVPLTRSHPAPVRTPEETVALVRRLAQHYSDATIASILNRQGRTTATGQPFTVSRVSSLRTHWKIPVYQALAEAPATELCNLHEAAVRLGVAQSTVLRWLEEGYLPGVQLTPGAPWQIRLTDEVLAKFAPEPPQGWLPLVDAAKVLALPRQIVMNKVKTGELHAVLLTRGRRRGLRIQIPQSCPQLFT